MKTIILDGIEYELVPKPTEPIYDDWRLPTIQELLTLVNYNKYEPACDLQDTISNNYWSFTTNANDLDFAWSINFFNGRAYPYDKQCSLHVRCVRTGRHGLEWSETSKTLMTWEEAIEYATSLKAPVYYKEHNDNLQ